tara:strand:+ start:46185 stop:47003 length:819 start_codon:yes stop_codon:yes gene_type:complete
MYTAHFVCAIKVDGKTMREFNSEGSKDIYLPFGSDYSLYLKNMDSRRAVVSISIDGEDVLDGTQIVIDGNDSMELEGFLNSSSNLVKNKFRFIEKSDKVREHRGEEPEDGLIRVEFQFEEPAPPPPPVTPWPRRRDRYPDDRPWRPDGPYFASHTKGIDGAPQSSILRGVGGSSEVSVQSFNCTHTPCSHTPVNDEGITVAGAQTHQKFGTTWVRRLDPQKHVMVFKLRGETGQQKPVSRPVTARRKVKCPTCGTPSRSDARFCGECATALV